MNRLILAALLLAATSAHAKDFAKGAAEQPAPSQNQPATTPRTLTQTELMQRQFPEGTTCHFQLTREQLQAMKPSELYIPKGNVVLCRQPFDSIREPRTLQL